MKAESTIRKQIVRLEKVCKKANNPRLRGESYETYHALRWVIENTSWTPAGMFEERLMDEKAAENSER